MTDNAVLRLRAERLARATRPFLARGNRIRRCQRCLLPLKQCLCATLTPAQATSRFCLVMFDTEPMKPSNTGRLIADILPIPRLSMVENRAAAGAARSGRPS
jgi:DTW domain-containing protein YfiP